MHKWARLMVSLPLARRVGNYLARRAYAPPRRKHHRSPSEYGLEFTEDTLTTNDGVALHLWVILPSDVLRGIGIVGHGIGLTKSASLRQARMLHDVGYGVVMYDHRNHGLSGVGPVQKGMAERFTRDTVGGLILRCRFWPTGSPSAPFPRLRATG